MKKMKNNIIIPMILVFCLIGMTSLKVEAQCLPLPPTEGNKKLTFLLFHRLRSSSEFCLMKLVLVILKINALKLWLSEVKVAIGFVP